MKQIITFVILILILSSSGCVFAQEDLYIQQAEQSGALDLSEDLPQGAKDILDVLDVDVSNINWASDLSVNNIFELFSTIFKNNGETILKPCISVVFILVISAVLQTFSEKISANVMLEYAVLLGVCLLMVNPFVSSVSVVTQSVQSACVFMSGLIPVYGGILFFAGQTATSSGFISLMLGATQIISFISAYIVLPLAGMYLAIQIALSFSTSIQLNGLATSVKKIAIWVLSVSLMIFLGILKIQTVVNTASDSLSMSTAKFVVGSSVPLVGSAVGEAFTTVKGCISLLESSVGMYGVLAVGSIFLPIVMQLFIWKLGIGLSIGIADLFTQKKISGILQSVADTLSFLLAVLVCTALFFIIGITMVCTGGNI